MSKYLDRGFWRIIFDVLKKENMTTNQIKAGSKIKFTETGHEFQLKTVTDKKVVWYVGFNYKAGSGKNNLKTASTSYQRFISAIDRGVYQVLEY